MGLNTSEGGGGRAGESGRTVAGNLVGAPTTAAPVSAALTMLLGSEDTIFRDPFADFTPSGR